MNVDTDVFTALIEQVAALAARQQVHEQKSGSLFEAMRRTAEAAGRPEVAEPLGPREPAAQERPAAVAARERRERIEASGLRLVRQP